MARQHRQLTIVYTTVAKRSLDEIWDWTAKQFGRDHAKRYIDFLTSETEGLKTTHRTSKPVPGHFYFH